MTDTSGRFDESNDPVMTKLGVCGQCKHQYANGVTCRAFREGIPEEIIFGDVMHTEPYPGDNGFQFEAVVR